MQLLRRWAAVAAETINSGHYTSARLRALMTPTVAAEMKQTFSTDIGLHYPGPIPFVPVRVSVVSRHARTVEACAVATGFAVVPRTHRPPHRVRLIPIDTGEKVVRGRWVLSRLLLSRTFSCAGVAVPTPLW